MPIISLVAAMATDRLIGRRGDLPWRLPADLRRFKRLTRGKPVIMGRKTHVSIGRPLPERRNLVLSRDPDARFPGVEVFGSLDGALAAVAEADEVALIGGAVVYAMGLARADRLYLSVVDGDFSADAQPDDVFFPEIDATVWGVRRRAERAADARNAWPHTFFELRRLSAEPELSALPPRFPAGTAPAPLGAA